MTEKFLRGADEITARLCLPWRFILCLAEFEGLPLEWKAGEITLNLADLEKWRAGREGAGE